MVSVGNVKKNKYDIRVSLKDEEQKIVYICESCYETVYEGFKIVEEGGEENGRVDKRE